MSAVQSKRGLGQLTQLSNVGGFFRWWGEGLLLWLPDSLRQSLTPVPERLVLELRDEDVIVSEEKGARARELQRYPRSALKDGGFNPQRLKGDKRPLVLRLSAQQALTREAVLPLAAENNLRQVVGFEIDRLTPFTVDKLHYDVHIISRQADNRTLKVRFTAILRTALDGILKQLNEAGIRPDAIDVDGPNAGKINLLPQAMRPRRGQTSKWLRVLLVIFVVITGLGLLLLPLWQQREVVVALMPQVQQAEQQAETALSLRTQLENAVETSRFLQQKRLDSVPIIDLVDVLTKALPDNTWVEQLIIKSSEVQIRGQSSDATALIAILEASDYFSQVTFRSPVTPDRRTGRDRFFLTATVTGVWPEAADAADSGLRGDEADTEINFDNELGDELDDDSFDEIESELEPSSLNDDEFNPDPEPEDNAELDVDSEATETVVDAPIPEPS